MRSIQIWMETISCGWEGDQNTNWWTAWAVPMSKDTRGQMLFVAIGHSWEAKIIRLPLNIRYPQPSAHLSNSWKTRLRGVGAVFAPDWPIVACCCSLVRGRNQEKRLPNTRRDRTIWRESQNLGFSLHGLRVSWGLNASTLRVTKGTCNLSGASVLEGKS